MPDPTLFVSKLRPITNDKLDLVSVVVVAVSINTRTRVKVSEVASSKTG